MENNKAYKTLLPYILISALVSVVIGLTISKGLFLSGGLIILVLINRIYTKGEGSLLRSDALFVGSIISIGGLSSLLLFGACFLVPRWTSCGPNSFRATVFAIVYFPLVFGFILWVALRLPMIVKSLVQKLEEMTDLSWGVISSYNDLAYPEDRATAGERGVSV